MTPEQIIEALVAAKNAFKNAVWGEDVRDGLVAVADAVAAAIENGFTFVTDDLSSQDPNTGIVVSALKALFDTTLIYRRVLTASDSLNGYLEPGMYYIYTNDAPTGYPLETDSRLLVINSGSSSYVFDTQILFTGENDVSSTYILYRVHPNGSSPKYDSTPWHKIEVDAEANGTLRHIKKLTSADSLNARIAAGTYYINSDSLPTGWPVNNAGRLLVVTSGTESLACQAQIAWYSGDGFAYRVHSNVNEDDDWAGVEWIFPNEEAVAAADAQSIYTGIPWVRGTISIVNNHATAIDSTGTRIRTLSTVKNVRGLKMAGYEAKRFYYSGYYGIGTDVGSLYAGMKDAEWQPLDSGLSTLPGMWCHILVRKADETAIEADELAAFRSGVEYSMLPPDQNLPYFQLESLPPTSTEYHALWEALLDGEKVKRTTLGEVTYAGLTYPMYAYEIHTNRNWVNANYVRVSYNGNNALYERPKILILAGVHGNEKCSPMDAFMLAYELLYGNLRGLAATCDFYFIPLLNPWGYSHSRLDGDGNVIYNNGGVAASIVESTYALNGGIRRNGDNYDINRDYSDSEYDYTGTVNGVSVTKTMGWKTQELQACKDFLVGTKWAAVVDLHQNHDDLAIPSDASAWKQSPSYTSIAHKDTQAMSTDELKNLQKLWMELDKCNAETDEKLQEYFMRGIGVQPTRIRENSAPAPTSARYFAGLEDANGKGNTEHTDIATPRAYVVETSEVCMTYSGLANQWYNPVACTVSTTTAIELIKSIITGLNKEA